MSNARSIRTEAVCVLCVLNVQGLCRLIIRLLKDRLLHKIVESGNIASNYMVKDGSGMYK